MAGKFLSVQHIINIIVCKHTINNLLITNIKNVFVACISIHMFLYTGDILGWTAPLPRADAMREHREERSRSADQQSRTHLVQIPWSKATVCSLSRNKDKGDVSILKGTWYIICWSGDLFVSHYPQSICAASKRHLHHCGNTPAHAADTHCGFPPQPSRLYFAAASNVALPSQRLCQMWVTFLNPQWQAKREEERHQKPSTFLIVLFTWCDNTQEEGGVNQPHPQEH